MTLSFIQSLLLLLPRISSRDSAQSPAGACLCNARELDCLTPKIHQHRKLLVQRPFSDRVPRVVPGSRTARRPDGRLRIGALP